MIQDDDIEQEMLDKALCFVCHRQMVDGNCPVCDDPETYKENAMTPEQIEKERETFESYITAAYTDPKTSVLKQDWNLKRDGEGYFWRNPSIAWKSWLARAEQPVWISTKDRLPSHGESVVFVYSNPEDCIDPEEDVYSDDLLADVGYCNHKHFGFVGTEYVIPREDVLYWQPFQEPPKGE